MVLYVDALPCFMSALIEPFSSFPFRYFFGKHTRMSFLHVFAIPGACYVVFELLLCHGSHCHIVVDFQGLN